MDLLELDQFKSKFVRELSTGTRRVVDLACLLAHRPSVILLDEPSSGIAQREAEALVPLLLRIRDQTEASLVVIEHDIPLVGAIADRLVAMDQGAIIATGLPVDVLTHPLVVESYLGTSDAAITRSGARPAPIDLKEPHMLPSSATPDGPRSSNLRRYGPLAAIVVVLLIIGVVVLASGGDDKKPAATTGTGSGSSSSNGPASTTGAISFSQAKAQGRTDLTFPDGCDSSTGRVAIPTAYPAECFVDQPAVTDPNTRGVTNDTITVVVYIPPDQDPILDFITAAINNNDTGDQAAATYDGYNELFQRYYQTYGRKVQLKFLRASGQSNDAVAARADAVKATEELGAFAVWGGPALTDAGPRS